MGSSASRLALLGGAILLALSVRAERLPIKSYTTADGLARNRITRIVPDSRGFIWICTGEGLSKFDGYRFVNYGTRDGIPHRIVNDILEDRRGTYWVATDKGLGQMHPTSPQKFFSLFDGTRVEFLESINALAEDRDGVIWAATDAGLFRVRGSRLEWVDIGLPRTGVYADTRALRLDPDGSLWIGGAAGLFHRLLSGQVDRFNEDNGLPDSMVQSIGRDSAGHLWAGTRQGLVRIRLNPQSGQNIADRVFSIKDGLADKDVKSLSLAPDGSLWAGCLLRGISEIRNPGGDLPTIRSYGRQEGLADETITTVAHDHEGNLWLGGESGGLMRIVRNGFVTYGQNDGLAADRAGEVFVDRKGDVYALGNVVDRGWIGRFDGERFHSVLPGGGTRFNFGWSWSQVMVRDHADRWWMATPWGLYGFPAVSLETLASSHPEYILTGRVSTNGFRVFEDAAGRIWASMAGLQNGMIRWDPATRHSEFLPPTNGPTEQLVSAIAQDRAGNMWLGLYGSGLVRYRRGQFTTFGSQDGVPPGIIPSLYLDDRGRLWIGSSDNGLGRIDQPDAEKPAIRFYNVSNGLSSDTVGCIVADQFGRIYAGTGRGLDRLDPETGRIRHYTTADGLANDGPQSAVRDLRGWLWFATTRGVSRLIPETDRRRPPPPIYITGLTVGGVRRPVSQLGESELSGLEFPSGNVQIEFAGLSLEAGESLSYEYSIEDTGERWNQLDRLRSVTLAGLGPGKYRFLVRAVDSQGEASTKPAAIFFRIPPPVWWRPWFVLLVVTAVAALLYGLYRARLAHVLELERIRMRIATDLHDDIGSSLSQIAILSEVAQRSEPGADAAEPLSRIAGISRELVDSMADIVWAINPQRDNLLDLTRRMRQFAGEVLVARDIVLDFDAADASPAIHLGTDLRRQVFLVFKEAVTNAARYSEATHVRISMGLDHGSLRLSIADDGRGFDLSKESRGHGLASMRARVVALGGHFEIVTESGKGAAIRVEVPLTRW